MDLSNILSVGEVCSREYIVQTEDTADYAGNKGVVVLSTPVMIKHMENTASQIVFEKLSNDYSPVGTKLVVEHLKPTFVNMKINVTARLMGIDGNKLTYDVKVFNEIGLAGSAIYEQRIIKLNRFLNKPTL